MVRRVEHLLSVSMAVSSFKVYKRAWVLYQQSMIEMGIDEELQLQLPITSQNVVLFIGYLSTRGFAPATITSYTTALGYAHKILDYSDPTSSYIVQKLLSSCNKIHQKVDSRLPITLVILERICSGLNFTVPHFYHRQLFHTMFVIAFFGLMRLAEITQDKQGQISIYLNQVEFTSTAVLITISKFKHNHSAQPVQIVLPAQQDPMICPVIQLKAYLKLRGSDEGPLFRYQDGRPISRNFFTSNLKTVLIFRGLQTSLYKSHSFRIGGSSYYCQIGLSDTQIRIMGRWKSDAFLKYIRAQRIGASLNCSTII